MSNFGSAPTLDDVAKMAGVSTATVSRCLNSPDRVVKKTRDKVMKAVDTLGYTPNFAAQVMAAKRTFTVGAIIPTMDNAIFARGLQAFQEELHARGYTLLVASSAYQQKVEEEQIKALVARGADGLLLIGHDRAATVYEYLAAQNVPTLVAWTIDESARVPSIGFDNRASMAALTEKVLGLGHRRIAMISGILEGNDRARLRALGLQDALKEQKIDAGMTPIIETPYEVENGGAAFAELMAHETPPTAILCGNDVLAVGAMTKARELGLRVPQDVSITGFDDIELARITDPPLTTVHVPHREMGRTAARELVDMVEKKSDGRSEGLPTSLCMRGSLAAPAG